MWTNGQGRTTLPPGGKGSSGGGLPRRPAVHPAGRLFFARVKAIGNSVAQFELVESLVCPAKAGTRPPRRASESLTRDRVLGFSDYAIPQSGITRDHPIADMTKHLPESHRLFNPALPVAYRDASYPSRVVAHRSGVILISWSPEAPQP